jgi:hypothetical protein
LERRGISPIRQFTVNDTEFDGPADPLKLTLRVPGVAVEAMVNVVVIDVPCICSAPTVTPVPLTDTLPARAFK